MPLTCRLFMENRLAVASSDHALGVNLQCIVFAVEQEKRGFWLKRLTTHLYGTRPRMLLTAGC